MLLKSVRVLCEQWYGSFRHGDHLGGCPIRDSAFASIPALKASEVVGAWEGSHAVARFDGSQSVSCWNAFSFGFVSVFSSFIFIFYYFVNLKP